MTDIELHIEELVLHGFVQADRVRIGAAVERELGRLLGEEGMIVGVVQRVAAAVNVGGFQVRSGAGAEEIGVGIAKAVFGGLNQLSTPARAGAMTSQHNQPASQSGNHAINGSNSNASITEEK